jgi:hypothetical protein
MRKSFLSIGIPILMLAMPLSLGAQEPPPAARAGWQVTIAPRFGVFLPNRDMGGEQDGVALTMTSSPTAGLDVEVRTPVHWLSVRTIAETSVGSRLAERGTPTADPGSCNGDCARDPEAVTPVGESSVLTFVADALVRPRMAWGRLQPMLFAGGGVKRYDLTLANRYVAGGQASAFTFHYGGGVDIPLGPISLSVEAADYVSHLRSTIRPVSTSIFVDAPPPPGEGTVKHDFFLTLGVRLFPR